MSLKSWLPPILKMGALGACAVALASALVACGGGTTQLDPFKAKRVIAFGDESSLLNSDGSKYTVNAVTADGLLDCTNNRLWVQVVADMYGFVFPQCNPTSVSSPQGVMVASAGAKADDLKIQVDAQVGAGGFSEGDLALVMIGANDILEVYARVVNNSMTEAAATEELQARGIRAAQQVNRLVDLGAKVVVSTAIDLGKTPFAVNTGTDASALLSRLSSAYNIRLRVNILQDGHYIGLVLADEMVQAAALNTLANVTTATCTAALPYCTTNTLVSAGTATSDLWADDLRIGASAQTTLGNLAGARARGNPF